MIDGWLYYNHAAIPACAPHESPNIDIITNGKIWEELRGGGYFTLCKVDNKLGLWI